MPMQRMPIVGMFYRPPAQVIVNALAVGTPMFLLAEPENEHDINAVAVRILSADIPDSALPYLEENLPPTGFTVDAIMAQEEWHLGYIPKQFAARLRAENIVPLDAKVPVTFGVNPEGQPRVMFEEPVL